jgi:hypothetical protein
VELVGRVGWFREVFLDGLQACLESRHGDVGLLESIRPGDGDGKRVGGGFIGGGAQPGIRHEPDQGRQGEVHREDIHQRDAGERDRRRRGFRFGLGFRLRIDLRLGFRLEVRVLVE